jgi:hypothetical protein
LTTEQYGYGMVSNPLIYLQIYQKTKNVNSYSWQDTPDSYNLTDISYCEKVGGILVSLLPFFNKYELIIFESLHSLISNIKNRQWFQCLSLKIDNDFYVYH